MNENISTAPINETMPRERARAFEAIAYGGLIVGVLDAAAASASVGLKGKNPAIAWQYVASGLLGRDSYNYGWKTVLLGLSIHFLIAFSVAAVYYAASRRLPFLLRQAVLCGALYGVIVYFVMGYVVSPLSATAKQPFSVSSMLTGILIHIFCVGLPAALTMRRFAKND